MREWAKRHPDKVKASKKAWQKSPAGKLSAFNRDSRRRNSPGSLTLADWLCSLEYFHEKCAYCASGRTNAGNLHKEHVVPIASAGVSWLYNIVPACESCNTSKSDSEWLTWFRAQPFYCPEREAKIQAHLDSKIEHTDRTEFAA